MNAALEERTATPEASPATRRRRWARIAFWIGLAVWVLIAVVMVVVANGGS